MPRRIMIIGHSLGVTLPRGLLKACGLTRGALVQVRRLDDGLFVWPARIVPARPTAGGGRWDRTRLAAIRTVLPQLKAGLSRIYGVRLKGVYLYRSSASDVRVLMVLTHVNDYGAEIERTGELVARLSLRYSVAISRVFLSERDWLKRRQRGARFL